MANGVAITKPAAAKKTARGGVPAQKKTARKERVLTPECFDKEFWAEMRVGLANAGVTETEYLQILMDVRRELREEEELNKKLGKTDEELLREEDDYTEEDIARAKREGRWINCGGKIPGKPRG